MVIYKSPETNGRGCVGDRTTTTTEEQSSERRPERERLRLVRVIAVRPVTALRVIYYIIVMT